MQPLNPTLLLFCPEPTMAMAYDKAAQKIKRHLVVVTPTPAIFDGYGLTVFPWLQGESISTLAGRLQEAYGTSIQGLTTSEIFLPSFAALSEVLGLGANKIEVYGNARDKWAMKTTWQKASVPSAKAALFADAPQAAEVNPATFPAIIKPRIGFASAGVRKVHDHSGYTKALKDLARVNRLVLEPGSSMQSGIIVEEFIDGLEFAVDTLWSRGEARAHFIMSREVMTGDTFPDTLYYVDQDLHPRLQKILCDAATQSGKALGITHGSSHTEIRVTHPDSQDPKAYIIETTPRAGAGGLFHFAFSEAYGIDTFVLAILSELTDAYSAFDQAIEEMELQAARQSPQGLTYYFQPPRQGFGIVEHVIGLDELRQRDFIRRMDIFCKPGSILLKPELSLTYWAWILGQAENKNSMTQQLKMIEETLGIVFRNV